MFLVQCTNQVLNNIFYPIKNILNIIMIISPILLIISLSVTFYKLVINPDEKKLIKNLKNSFIALVIIFLIPLFVNLVVGIVDEQTEITSCYKNAVKHDNNSEYIDIYNKDKKKVIYSMDDYKNGEDKPSSLEFSNGSDTVKVKFTEETLKIVEAHLNDFNYNNFRTFMNSHGGAGNYIKSLGGVFTKYYGSNKKVTTVAELQEVSEYVFGLMYIYGFDYYNGNRYCKWGGGCSASSKGSSDAFYPGTMKHTSEGLSERNDFDALITGKNETNMTTNCNWTVDMVYVKAGLFKSGHSAGYKGTCKRIITDVTQTKVGDLIHFFNTPINKLNKNTWNGWYHVAYVGEVYDDKVVVYDGGSYFTTNRNFKWEFKKSNQTKVIHGSSNWVICRSIDIE